MKGDNVLDLESVDLGDLANALEDHSWEHTWWLDPESGEVVLWSDYSREQGEPDPESRGLIGIEPIPSHEGYGDMEDFIALVRDPRVRESLARAIEGRGAFRRFKDTLLEFPELRAAWFKFHDARMERRALEWLADEGLVDRDAAERAMGEDPELPEISGPFDPFAIAHAVAEDLRRLYGGRLKKVLLFGSWARGDAHPDSDIDLLVVLDRVDSVWEELRRMNEILDRHSVANETVISAMPVPEADVAKPATPVLIRATIEGQAVA
jgi:predicted nucleotidyltransferase